MEIFKSMIYKTPIVWFASCLAEGVQLMFCESCCRISFMVSSLFSLSLVLVDFFYFVYLFCFASFVLFLSLMFYYGSKLLYIFQPLNTLNAYIYFYSMVNARFFRAHKIVLPFLERTSLKKNRIYKLCCNHEYGRLKCKHFNLTSELALIYAATHLKGMNFFYPYCSLWQSVSII